MSLAQNAKKTAKTCKLLSSDTRCLILLLLQGKNELCVKDIASEVGITQSAISHQLTRLEQEGVLSSSRSGKTVCYSLADTKMAKSVERIIKEVN